MKRFLFVLCIAAVAIAQTCTNVNQATDIDFAMDSKYSGVKMQQLGCNQQTNIDFSFGQAASGSLNMNAKTAQNYLTFTASNGNSKLQFLDLNGNNRSYSLHGISLVDQANRKVRITGFPAAAFITHEISFTYRYDGEAEDTILVVYLNSGSSINYNVTGMRNVVSSTSIVPSGVQTFRNLVQRVSELVSSGAVGTIEQLAGAMSPFSSMDFGKFYTVQTNDAGCKTNYLISSFVYNVNPSSINASIPISGFSYKSSNQQATGDLLCYGSHITGMFQTHMRQSYPLWAAWFAALFFWCAILFAESNTTISLYDRKFLDNRWTSWEMYSLFYLAQEQFFTRMLRTTSVYVCFTIACVVNACLYGELGVANPTAITILWIGIIGAVASFIFSFPLGFFLTGFYDWNLTKFEIKKKVKDLQDKESIEAQTFDRESDQCDDMIYTYYYWYYVFCVIVLFICWAISVNEMQKLPRENYYQMWYWVGSVGISFIGNVFVLAPIFTALFGDKGFFKYRGFWYDFRLGQTFKQIQE